jgi:tRNA-Thr(GGU) m(6)t(6)A37 methyltransferase TsaA
MQGAYAGGEPIVNAAYEMAEVGWFAWDALPQPLFLSLQHLLDGKCYPPQLTPYKLKPIGLVSRLAPDENERDRALVAKIVLDEALAPALDGIEEWSHIYVIFWLDRPAQAAAPVLHHASSGAGVLAARSPIHPNPIGLTLVELVKREANVLWVRGLDAYEGTHVLDIKPYPDWEQGRLQVVTDFRVPEWLKEIVGQPGQRRHQAQSE